MKQEIRSAIADIDEIIRDMELEIDELKRIKIMLWREPEAKIGEEG